MSPSNEPTTKLDLVYAIRDLLHIKERGVLESYEFDTMRKRSLRVIYRALAEAGTTCGR